MPRTARPLIERLATRTQYSLGGCWAWSGNRNSNGYGMMSVPGKQKQLAHRVSYETHIGAIPEGLTIDHLCRNRACVRPTHLEPVTVAENNARRPHVGRRPGVASTHCRRGHEVAGANVYLSKDATGTHRKCRQCHNDGQARRRANRKAVAA